MRGIPGILLFSMAMSTVFAIGMPKPNLVSRISTLRPERCNINVCFAIDGSVPLKSWQFQLQKNFVARVVRETEAISSMNVAGVQYGLDNLVISPLTNDKRLFLNALINATFSAAESTFISGGISYCHRQVRSGPEQSNKIVLLGSGKADFGGDPAIPARIFRHDGGELFAIEVGTDPHRNALEDIAGSEGNIFTLSRGRDVIPAVTEFLPRLCDTKVSMETEG